MIYDMIYDMIYNMIYDMIYDVIYDVIYDTGCFKKNFTLGVSINSPAINMLEG